MKKIFLQPIITLIFCFILVSLSRAQTQTQGWAVAGADIRAEMKPERPPVSVTYFTYKNTVTDSSENFFIPTSAQDSIDKIKLGYKVMNWRDPNWTEHHIFLATVTKKVDEGIPAKITSFSVFTRFFKNITDSLLDIKGYSLWFISVDVQYNGPMLKSIAALTDDAMKNGLGVVGISSSSANIADTFRVNNNLHFPFYYCDRLSMKPMLNVNQGLILLKNGVIINSWRADSIPTAAALKKYMQ